MMKKLTFIAILFTTLLTTSCFTDYEDDDVEPSANLSSTSWLSTSSNNWDEDFEYLVLVFTTSSQVEIWSKMVNEGAETKDDTGSYTISGSSITVDLGSLSLSGTFSAESMTVSGDGDTYYYNKQ